MWNSVSTSQDLGGVARRVLMASSSAVSNGMTSPNLGYSGLDNMEDMSGKYSVGTSVRSWEVPCSSGSVRTSFVAMMHDVALWTTPVSARTLLNVIQPDLVGQRIVTCCCSGKW